MYSSWVFFVPFSDPNVLAKLIPRLFPICIWPSRDRAKSDSWLAALRKALFKTILVEDLARMTHFH